MTFGDKLLVFLAGIIVFLVYIVGVDGLFHTAYELKDALLSISALILTTILGVGGFAGFIGFLFWFFDWANHPKNQLK